MKLLAHYTFIVLFLMTGTAQAQMVLEQEESRVNLGLGLGISYGGIGTRLSYLPVKYVALFGAAGYNFDGFGYSLGTEIRLLPDKGVVPTLLAMYGYNGVVVVQSTEDLSRTYYGPTIGGGMEIHSRNQESFFTVELLVPFRSQAFWDHVEVLRNDPNYDMVGPWPLAFSFGYHFKFNR